MVIGWWSKRQMDRLGLSALLANRPANALPPDVVDLWFLYRQVRKRKPRCILEFGAGCSTVIMAQALSDNGNGGHLYSVDAVPYWAQATFDALPAHLRDSCSISSSEIVVVDYNGSRVLRHAQVPDVTPDFVYLDGPDFASFADRAIREAACDPLDLERHVGPAFFMVVDGRMENRKFLQENLRRKYAISNRWPFQHWKTAVYELIS